MTRSVEASASTETLNAKFNRACLELNHAIGHLHLPTNGFNATAARRQLIELCVKVADEFGNEVRHGGR